MHLLLEADLLLRKGKLDRAKKRLAFIARKKLNAELKAIFSDIQFRLNTAKRASKNFAQEEYPIQKVLPNPHEFENHSTIAHFSKTVKAPQGPIPPPGKGLLGSFESPVLFSAAR